MAGWYVRRGEKIIGPVPNENLRESAATGKLLPTDQLAKDAAGPWTDAANTEFFPKLAGRFADDRSAGFAAGCRRDADGGASDATHCPGLHDHSWGQNGFRDVRPRIARRNSIHRRDAFDAGPTQARNQAREDSGESNDRSEPYAASRCTAIAARSPTALSVDHGRPDDRSIDDGCECRQKTCSGLGVLWLRVDSDPDYPWDLDLAGHTAERE